VDPYIGEIKLWSFAWAPTGWLLCDGTMMQVAQNQALFSLINNSFGGDGRTTFALPDLRGRTPVGVGVSPADPSVTYNKNGLAGGVEKVTLSAAQVPAHVHTVAAVAAPGTQAVPTGNLLASVVSQTAGSTTDFSLYQPAGSTQTVALNSGSVSVSGGGSSHSNMQPYMVVNFCICTTNGLYPPRN
jgi:microcystin-dependent protein